MGKRSKMQTRAQRRNFLKMRVAGAVTLKDVLYQPEYEGLLHPAERLGIENACTLLEGVLNVWRKR